MVDEFQVWIDMKVLITGDEGFVGSATKEYLRKEQNWVVVGYDIVNGYDFTDESQFAAVLEAEKPDRILHLGAVANFAEADKHPIRAYETNARGTQVVAQLAGRHHIPLVYSSTGSVYMPITDKPPITESFPVKGNSVYGCSKCVGELYVQRYANPYIVLRYAHLYGRGKRKHGLVAGAIERIRRGAEPRRSPP